MSTESSNTPLQKNANSVLTNYTETDSVKTNIETNVQVSAEIGIETHIDTCEFADSSPLKLAERFRKFLPVVVDVETAGFNAQTDALLEIAFLPILMNAHGQLVLGEALSAHIEPFEGANLEQSALDFTGIDPSNPMRKAIAEDEQSALRRIFKELKAVRKAHDCRQCVLIGHNAHFDLAFLNAAITRSNSKNQSPFHSFSVFDTVSLSALAFGQTVLARACYAAGIDFDNKEAHSALYDTIKTGELFCKIVNTYPMLAHAIYDDEKDTDSEQKTALETEPTTDKIITNKA